MLQNLVIYFCLTAIAIAIAIMSGCAQNEKRLRPPGERVGPLEALSPFLFEIKEKNISGKILGKAAPFIEVNQNNVYIASPVANNKLLECFLYDQSFDGAEGIHFFHQLITETVIKRDHFPPAITGFSVGLYKHYPYFTTDSIIYHRQNENQFTNIKMASISLENNTLFCSVYFPITTQSFADHLHFIIDHLQLPPNKNSQTFQVVNKKLYLLRGRQYVFGWSWVNTYLEPTAQSKPIKRVETLTSSLSPGHPHTFVTHDWLSQEYYDDSHLLLSGDYQYARLDELVFQLSLGTTSDQQYQVKGEYFGKPITSKISYNSQSDRPVLHQNYLNEVIHSPNITAEYQHYVPHLSPISFLPVRSRLTNDGIESQLENMTSLMVQKGPHKYRLTTSLGGQSLSQELVLNLNDKNEQMEKSE
jgi:hypothetical protein